MKNFLIIFLISISLKFSLCQTYKFEVSKSIYYQEKYFRFLANNYENIQQGDYWKFFKEENGIGFQAIKDFGSFLLVKDWSIYSFKLTKIIFRPYCKYSIDDENFDAELLLYHTIDNNYFPPGKRIYLGINYLIISVPFKKTNNDDPSIDKLLDFLNLEKFSADTSKKIGPEKPIKLYQMIQHQPQFLFEAKDNFSGEKTLYLIFSQYHKISDTHLESLTKIYEPNEKNLQFNETTIKEFYRNFQNPYDLTPKLTLMTYNNQYYLKLKWIMIFFIYFIFI